MRAFIEFYKSMPELWNCKNESYKNRNMRNRSYNKLLTEYKKVKSDGTVEKLKKKIANMRTCYRRELKKCIKSEKSGAGADDIYLSNLWCYDAFDFLRDLEMPLPGRSTLSSDEGENGLVTSIGLERVAEELMGRRKWKQYQETLMRTHLNSDQFVASIEDNNIELKKELDKFKSGEFIEISITTATSNANHESNHLKDTEKIIIKAEQKEQEHENYKDQQELSKSKEISQSKHHPEKANSDEKREEQQTDIKQNNKTASQNPCEEIVISDNNNCSNSSQENVPSETKDITVKNFKLDIKPSLDSLSKSQSSPSPPPPDPIDWKPNDKCHFCVNGKLLTVNAKGELVAESGPTGSETDHIERLDCESDSNESSSVAISTNTNGNVPLMTGAGPLTENNQVTLNKLLTQKMASMDSVAAQFAAIQSILPNFNWMNHQQQQSQPDSVTPTTSDISAAAISPSLKDSPSPGDATGEQPLDLSSKPSPNSSISGDLKSVRIKSSRATPVPSARRTYSEEDLNNALQEILSGRLGTRKAAVQFNVPRSTLRNKIYKLTTEAKCNNQLASPELLQLQKELEKEMSGDDEGEIESNASTPQLEDGATNSRISTPNLLQKLCINNGEGMEVSDQSTLLHASPKPAHSESSKPQTTEGTPEHSTQGQISALDAALPLLLQTLLLSDKNLRDVFSALLLNSTNNLKDILLGATAPSNSAAASGSDNNSLNNGNQQQDYRPLLQLLLQQQQQQQQQPQSTSFVSGRRLPKSETPETNSSLDPSEACDDPSAILKIPSYTPVAGSSNPMGPNCSTRGSPALICHNSNSNSNRNGDSPGPLLLAAAVNAAHKQLNSKNLSVTPPLLHGGVDNQPPQSLRISDVIANSIHRTMNEQANKEAVHSSPVSMLGYASNSDRNSVGSISVSGDYKKPTISVVKNIGGTDTSRFGTAPNLLAADLVQHHHHSTHLQHAHHHLSRQEAAALAAGKGTRPKRGKYRNYDRDSLVEAVKAVQRGEMSVHRAGSYYGVPHSTLEYKVKERHLMRPRKREPKPQPGLEGSSSSSKTNTNIPSGLTGLDKLKPGNAASNTNIKLSGAGIKSNGGTGTAPFPGNAANGMKLPIFDPALAHLPYASPLFWQHNQAAAFSQLQMDFNRNTTASSASSPNETSSEILKSHMQRYQDMTGGGGGGGASSIGGNTTTNSSNGPSPISSPILLGQDINRARELYESNAANGASFLDGIIRKTLDRKSNEVSVASTSASGGVLLDQLLMKKTPLPFTNNRSNEYNSLSPTHIGSLKRSGSPLSLSGTSIKRERNSPHSGGDSDDDEETSQSGMDENYEQSNNKSGHCGIKPTLGQRSRLGSHDSNSETDNSSLKSELQISNHQLQVQHNSTNNVMNMMDVNGGCGIGNSSGISSISVKTEIPNLETGTSILQEKLSQIKAEQHESEENL